MGNTLNFATEQLDGKVLVLFLHDAGAPDDQTWNAAMDEVARQFTAVTADKIAFLVITDGGAPSTTQRQRLAQVTREARHPIAVVNNSALVRGVITAISWMNPGIKPFAPNKWNEAVAYCGCSAESAVKLLAKMRVLQRELGRPVACLDAIVPGKK